MHRSIGLALFAVLLGNASAAVAETPGGPTFWVLVGTYTRTTSKGIYRFAFDPATGKAGHPELAAAAGNPSFLAIPPDRKHLYAVGDVDDGGKKGGGVLAFALDPAGGRLTELNGQSLGDRGTCHISVDRTGRAVVVANYYEGSAAALPVRPDGTVGAPASFVKHHGSGPNKSRQEAPHPHSITVDPGNRFAVVADLGIDQVRVYRLDPEKAMLTPNDPPGAAVAPGAGPRHFAFHPSARFGYVMDELNNTVTVFDYDARKGVLKPKQAVRTLPAGFHGSCTSAEVAVHPSGRFLYGSNRGDHNSIAVFAIDPATGRLTPVQDEAEGLKTPRHFAVDPTGRWLLAANEDGDSIVIFRIDRATGRLTRTPGSIPVPVPVCVRFVPRT